MDTRAGNQDRARAVESLTALESLAADVVVPGHGPLSGKPAEAVRLARAGAAV